MKEPQETQTKSRGGREEETQGDKYYTWELNRSGANECDIEMGRGDDSA
jgi:hypothetical protein